MQLLSPKVKEIQEKYKETSSDGISGIREVLLLVVFFQCKNHTKLSNQIKGFWISSIHLEFPNGGFLKWWYPQIIHFNRVFNYFHHPFWGKIPYFWKHPNDRHGFFSWKFPPVPREDDPDTQQRLLGQLYSVMDVNPSGSEMVRSASSNFHFFFEFEQKDGNHRQMNWTVFFFLLSLDYVDIIIYNNIYLHMIFIFAYTHNFIMICKNELLSSPSDSTSLPPKMDSCRWRTRQAWWLLASAVAATNLLEPLGMPAIHWGMGKPTDLPSI